MPQSLGEAVLDLSADIPSLKKDLDKAKFSVKDAIGGLGKIAMVGLGAATAAVGGLGAAIGKLAIDAAPLEGIENAFEGLTAGMEGGSERMLNALQQASLGMVTNRDLMTSFNKAAQLVSIDFAKTLPDAMEPLGKVAAATGQDISFLMNSLVTGIGRLSPMILDNLGIQVDLTAAYEEYAIQIGKTADELTKGEQQTALMNQVMAKLAENTAAMPDITGSAAQQWGVFQTQLKNLKDQIGLAFLPIFTQVLTSVNQLAAEYLPVLVKWLKDNLPTAIQKATDFWNTKLFPALKAIWNFIDSFLIPILVAIWKFLFVTMMPVWEALAELIGVIVVKNIEILVGWWQNILHPALKAVWGFIQDNIIPIFKGWSDSIGGISGAIQTVVGWLKTLSDWLSNIELPDWLKPGSPTPFEVGLRGITDAMREMNAVALPKFARGFQNRIPGMINLSNIAPGMLGAGMAMAPMTSNRNFNLTINTSAPYEPMVDNFRMMESMYR